MKIPTNKPDDGQSPSTESEVDDAARADYEKSKSDGKLFSNLDGNKITETTTDGESTWSKWPRQRGAK